MVNLKHILMRLAFSSGWNCTKYIRKLEKNEESKREKKGEKKGNNIQYTYREHIDKVINTV